LRDQAPERTNCFVDRQQASLASIVEQLSKNMHLVITGLPGVGKTELAIQVFDSSMVKNKYKGYFWLNAATKSSFKSDLFQMARALDVADESEDIEDTRRSILNVLNTEDSWLMVLDNVDDFELIERFCPLRHGQRHVIITARRWTAVNFNAWHIQLELMRENEAMELFLNACSFSKELTQKGVESEESARSLVQMLGLHPLAIIQAAAYLRANQDTVESYIAMYQDKTTELLQWKPFGEGDYVSVSTTIVLSFSKLKNHTDTVRLFCAIAFLCSDNIPLSLCERLSNSDQSRSQGSEKASSRKFRFNSALEPLFAYSFVKRVSGEFISIHRLVQDAIRAVITGSIKDTGGLLTSLNPDERMWEYWVERTVNRIQLEYPVFSSPDKWRECDLYTPHAESCMRYAENWLNTEALSRLKRAVASHMFSCGDFERAEMLCSGATNINQKIFGFESLETADTLRELAQAHAHQAHHDQAIRYFNDVLSVYQMVYKRETNSDTRLMIYKKMAIATHGRANVYNSFGLYSQAVEHYKLALEMKETVLAQSRLKLKVTNTLDGLAKAYSHQGDYEKAQELYLKSLSIHQTSPDRIAEANTQTHIGNMYSQCDFDRSLHHYGLALSIYDELYGVDRILSTKPLNGMGNIYVILGRYEEGIQYYRRALRIREALYGEHSWHLANTINNLGNAFDCLGKILQAKTQYDRALKIYEMELGPGHPKSVLALRNCGNVHFYYGNYEDAFSYYNRARECDSREDPMFSAKLFLNLASIRSHQGYQGPAHDSCKQALEIIERLCSNNITFAMAISCRGDIFCHQKEFSEAMKDYERALKIYNDIFRSDSVQSMETIVKMGNVYHTLGSCHKAIDCFESVHNFYEKIFGKDHVNIGPIIRNIGYVLKKQGYCDRAKEQYRHAIMIYQKTIETMTLVNKVDGASENLIDLSPEELEGKLQAYEREVGKAHYSWPDTLITQSSVV